MITHPFGLYWYQSYAYFSTLTLDFTYLFFLSFSLKFCYFYSYPFLISQPAKSFPLIRTMQNKKEEKKFKIYVKNVLWQCLLLHLKHFFVSTHVITVFLDERPIKNRLKIRNRKTVSGVDPDLELFFF